MAIRSRLVTSALALAVVFAPGAALAVDPSAMSCPQLWHRKNAILKAAGVCFTDPRAVRAFGNEGCHVSDPVRAPLTAPQRGEMTRIVLAEKIKSCR